jgi:hypothetical protein
MGALYRSDDPHFLATTMALPLLIAISLRWLPKTLADEKRGRAFALITFVGLVAWSFPRNMAEVRKLTFFRNPLAVGIAPEGLDSSPSANTGIGAKRLGFRRVMTDRCCQFSKASSDEFLRITQALYNHLGTKKVLVVDSIEDLDPGTLYFFADLNPASRHTSPQNTIPHSLARAQFLEELESSELDCIVTAEANGMSDERRIFERKHAAFSLVAERTANGSFSILCGA